MVKFFKTKHIFLLAFVASIVMPFLAIFFAGLWSIQIDGELSFSFIPYIISDLLYPLLFLIVFFANILLVKQLSQASFLTSKNLESIQLLIKASFFNFFFLFLSTIAFSVLLSPKWVQSFWIASFSVGLLFNIVMGFFLARSGWTLKNKALLFLGLSFVLVQVLDYSGFRIFLVILEQNFVESTGAELLWSSMGLSVFDYNSLDIETKNLFEEILALSSWIFISIGFLFVLLKSLALTVFYSLSVCFLSHSSKIKTPPKLAESTNSSF